jgi:putative two-component system response regulator
MIPDSLRDSRILIVDDEQANVALLESLLRRWGVSDVVATTNSSEVVELCSVGEPDLILLDLHMPPPDGFEVLSQLTPWIRGVVPVPVLVLTADVSTEVKRRALAHGARDFVAKPFDLEEVRLRTTNLLETRRLQRDLHVHGELLETRISERTRELEEARTDVLQRLARAAEYRDDDTGEHTRRVGRSARLIAIELGLGGGTAEQLALAAPLHDIGKIAIPDAILLKPGPLTESEFEQMKQHVVIGAELLAGSTSPVLETARQIVLSHHERWGGAGYPRGIAGEEIPVEGRIVAVADVFDALTHERPYKQAWSAGRAVETVIADAGRAFDPDVVEAFAALNHEHLLATIEGARRARLVVAKLPDGEAPEPEEPAAPRRERTRAVRPARRRRQAPSVSPAMLRR